MPKASLNLLVLTALPEPVLDIFRSNANLHTGSILDAATLQPDAIVCSIDSPPFDAREISRLPDSVKAIATYSVGYDHVDLKAAKKRDIAVFNTPGVLGDAVADSAMLLILGAARRATESISLLREGRWQGWSPGQLLGIGLGNKTLGILGMGDIGRRVAMRARAFGMHILYHNRKKLPEQNARFFANPREMIAESDVLLLAWPSTPATRRFIRADTLALAKPNMILINIGRGDLVHDKDLINSLTYNDIYAAGLDVFDGEPHINSAYLELPNAFLLPHIGSSTWEARKAMAQILIDGLEDHMSGVIPANRLV